MAANSAVLGPIRPNFELVQDLIVVLATCKNDEDPIKNEGASVHSIIQQFFSGVGGGIWPKFNLIQAFMHGLVTCKNDDDRIKNEGAKAFTRFLPL